MALVPAGATQRLPPDDPCGGGLDEEQACLAPRVLAQRPEDGRPDLVVDRSRRRRGRIHVDLVAGPERRKLDRAGGEAAGNFARKALAEVTGLSGRDEGAWRQWHRNYLELIALEGQAGPEVERVLAVLERAASVRLKARVLDLLVRKRLVASCPALIDELSSSDEEYRRRVTEVLERLTGQRFSSEAKGAGARQEAEQWRVFWRENGAKIVAAARIRGLLAAIDAPTESGAAGEVKSGTGPEHGAGAEE